MNTRDVQEMLEELLRFDRKTKDKVKVDRMTRVIAITIASMGERTSTKKFLRALINLDPKGHA